MVADSPATRLPRGCITSGAGAGGPDTQIQQYSTKNSSENRMMNKSQRKSGGGHLFFWDIVLIANLEIGNAIAANPKYSRITNSRHLKVGRYSGCDLLKGR